MITNMKVCKLYIHAPKNILHCKVHALKCFANWLACKCVAIKETFHALHIKQDTCVYTKEKTSLWLLCGD